MANIEELKSVLEQTTADLPKVTWRRMFGCDASFADGTIFGLVWKEGRLGVKLPDAKEYDALMKIPGAAPWKAGPMQMAHWVLVPKGFHTSKGDLKKWVKKAHALSLLNPKAKGPKKLATKRTPKH